MRIIACSPSSSHIPFVSLETLLRSSSRKEVGFCSGGGRVRLKRSGSFSFRDLKFRRNSFSNSVDISPWDEKPYDLTLTGKKAYLDELDVATLLDPPKELIPLEPASYNPAGYLWKKMRDIPEERRHRLLYLLRPRHVSRMWEMTGTRYDDPKLLKQSGSELLSLEGTAVPLEFWSCRTNGVPMSLAWMNRFNKVIFRSKDGDAYGRMFPRAHILQKVANSWYPCYFRVRDVQEVMSTEQPCDLAYDFGDGLLESDIVPEGFPNPATHPLPLDDQIVIYVRHAGPGVMVGQAWQEGKIMEQVPKKFCGEILMVKDYYTVAETS